MAQPGSTKKKKSIKINYIRSDNCRTVLADGSVIIARADPIGTLVDLYFTRVFTDLKDETLEVEEENGLQKQVSTSNISTTGNNKVVEAVVMMRPDHAMALAAAIMNHLSQLPEIVRLTYNIPDISALMESAKG